MKVGVPLSIKRANATCKERIEGFYTSLNHTVAKYHVKTGNIVNIDETGVSGREISQHKVLGSSETTIALVSEHQTYN